MTRDIVIEIEGGVVVDFHGLGDDIELHVVDWDIRRDEELLKNAHIPSWYIEQWYKGLEAPDVIKMFIEDYAQ